MTNNFNHNKKEEIKERNDLIKAVQNNLKRDLGVEIPIKTIEVILCAVLNEIADTLVSGKEVSIHKFGRWGTYVYPEAVRTNYITEEEIYTPEMDCVKFSAHPPLKKKVRHKTVSPLYSYDWYGYYVKREREKKG
jgi:nucleoid DNA-binding protein